MRTEIHLQWNCLPTRSVERACERVINLPYDGHGRARLGSDTKGFHSEITGCTMRDTSS